MSVILSIYFPVFLLLSLFSIITIDREGSRYINVYLAFSFIILVLFAGLRHLSPDQITYSRVFEHAYSLFELLENGSNFDDSELLNFNWGFLTFISFIKVFTSNVTLMFLTIAFINIWMVIYSCKKLSPYPMLSVLSYYSWFYYFNLGALRHATLAAVMMLLLVVVINNKAIKSFFLYLYALTLHKVGVFILSIYLVKKLKLKSKSYSFFLIVGLAIGFFGGIAYLAIELLYQFLPGSWQEKIYINIALERFSGKEDLFRGQVFKQLAILVACLFYFSALTKRYSDKFNILFGTYFVSTICLFLFIDFKLIGDRVSNLLAVVEIILIPMLLSIVTSRERFYVLLLIIIVMFLQITLLYGDQFYYYKSILFAYDS
jgi:hypothetical protein